MPLLLAALLALFAPAVAAAQELCDISELPSCPVNPEASIYPPPTPTGIRVHRVTVGWSDRYAGLAGDTRQITLNGSDITSRTTYEPTGRASGGQVTSAESQFDVTLEGGTNTITARICNTASHCTDPVVEVQIVHDPALGPQDSVSVTPDDVPLRPRYGAQHTAIFTLWNMGRSPLDLAISVQCSGAGVSNCAPHQPTASVPEGGSVQVGVNYTAGAYLSTGTIELTASSAAATDRGTYLVTADSTPTNPGGGGPLPIVELCEPVMEPNCPVEPEFTVSPAGIVTDSIVEVRIRWTDRYAGLAHDTREINLSASGYLRSDFTYVHTDRASGGQITGAESVGTLVLAPNSPTLIRARICNGAGHCSAFREDTVLYDPAAATSVRVTPDGTALAATAGAGGTAVFQVQNALHQPQYVSLSATCTGDAASECRISTRASLTLPANSVTPVAVTFRAGATGSTGTVQLSAQGIYNSDAGAQIVSAGAAPPVALMGEVGDHTRLDRGACVTIAIAPDVANECGQLRITHALPTTRVLNRGRTPVLVYNSQNVSNAFVVGATITPPTDVTNVTAKFRLAGRDEYGSDWDVHYGSVTWRAGEAKRVVVERPNITRGGTRVVDYTFEVTGDLVGGQQQAVLFRRSGKVVVIDRGLSPFGNGWWLAGVEQLVANTDGSKLWVGGDGSYRVYRPAGTGVWAADAHDRVDDTLRQQTVVVNGVSQQGFVRSLPGRGSVVFDAAGQHIRTENALGQITDFTWANGRLVRVGMPRVAGGFNTGEGYTFEYNTGGTQRRLSRVVAPGNRVTTIEMTSGAGIDAIVDPDSSRVAFASTSSGIVRRWDRRGHSISLSPEAGYLVGAVFQPEDPAKQRQVSFSPQALVGWGVNPIPVANFETTYTDPRGHKTRFLVNSFGAPVRIHNALGHETTIQRTDTRFPALPTLVRSPNGREVTATYDARGNLASSTDWGTARNGRYATTLYEWDPVWDAVTQVTRPEGEMSRTAYDAFGRRDWVQPGTDPARRTTFQYHAPTHATASGLPEFITQPALAGKPAAVERMEYDARGNLSATVTPRGVRVEYLNDPLGRLVRTRTPVDSAQTRFKTDTMVYDLADRVRRAETFAQEANGTEQRVAVRTDYDREGNVLEVMRRSIPDATSIDSITTRWEYDIFGHRTVEFAPDATLADWSDNPRDSTFYDAAGNVTRVRTRRGHQIHMTYDKLNRLEERLVEAVPYGPETRGIPSHSGVRQDVHGYNRPYGNLTVPASRTVFTYDTLGNIKTADNDDARISRTYRANGLLESETLRVRTVAALAAGGSFDQHVYTTTYEYDLNGRRTDLLYPTQLAQGAGRGVQYSYDEIGQLRWVNDPLSNSFGFRYNARGEQDSLSLAGRVVEMYGYDADGNLTEHRVGTRGSTSYLRDQTFEHDVQGRVRLSRSAVASKEVLTTQYSAIGHLGSNLVQWTGTNGWRQEGKITTQERFELDALGNKQEERSVTRAEYPDGTGRESPNGDKEWTYERGTGRLLGGTVSASGIGLVERDTTLYDQAGNVVFVYRTLSNINASEWMDRASFYSADNMLRFMETRWYNEKSHSRRFVFEEYRYDAFGRRVLVRTTPGCEDIALAMECRLNRTRRIVWDGDQELAEILMPDASMENDTAWTLQMPDPDQKNQDMNAYFGRVLYTHGPRTDQPLSVVRVGYSDWQHDTGFKRWASFAIVPLWNSRGQPEAALRLPGMCDDRGRCIKAQWPEGWRAYNLIAAMDTAWHGSLLNDKKDGTGTFYRRNRVYDPQTGRFTQEDPIGLAGGLNLYGFANGDPVTYSDPYGLCSQADGWKEPCWRPTDLTSWSSWKTWFGNAWSGRAAGTGPATSGEVAELGASIAGGLGGAARAGGLSRIAAVRRGASNPLLGTRYTGKVRQQMRQGDFHSFPLEVDNFAAGGTVSTIRGGDGVTRTKVVLPGNYKGRDGHFEWIVEPDKTVNHRLFVPDRR